MYDDDREARELVEAVRYDQFPTAVCDNLQLGTRLWAIDRRLGAKTRLLAERHYALHALGEREIETKKIQRNFRQIRVCSNNSG